MTPTAIIECSNCTGLLLANLNQKTRLCPYCGSKIDLKKARCVATAQTAFEASEILRKLKAQRQTNIQKPKPKEPTFPKKTGVRKTN